MKSGVLVPVAVVLACLPFACAAPGPAPRTYQQAPAFVAPPRPAPRAPGAPGFNPAEDAPHRIGHPGQRKRNYPESPYERVLPQDEKTRREPGLWSAEVPKASNDEGEVPASFLWKQFFFPDDTDFGQARRVKDECVKPYNEAGGVIDAMHNNAFKNIPAKYTEREWACFMAIAYQRCVAELHKSNEAARAAAYLNRTEPPFTMKDVSAAASILRRDRCNGVILPKDLSRMLDEVIRLMDSMRHGNQGPRN